MMPLVARLWFLALLLGRDWLVSAGSSKGCADLCRSLGVTAYQAYVPGLGSPRTPYGEIYGTSPFCKGSCEEDCPGRVCRKAWKEMGNYGKGCATGSKVCCCGEPAGPNAVAAIQDLTSAVPSIDALHGFCNAQGRIRLIRAGFECASDGKDMGKKDTLAKCADAVQAAGGRYFIYGYGDKVNRCWSEETTRSCPDGWEKDEYAFYEVLGAPSDAWIPKECGLVVGSTALGGYDFSCAGYGGVRKCDPFRYFIKPEKSRGNTNGTAEWWRKNGQAACMLQGSESFKLNADAEMIPGLGRGELTWAKSSTRRIGDWTLRACAEAQLCNEMGMWGQSTPLTNKDVLNIWQTQLSEALYYCGEEADPAKRCAEAFEGPAKFAKDGNKARPEHCEAFPRCTCGHRQLYMLWVQMASQRLSWKPDHVPFLERQIEQIDTEMAARGCGTCDETEHLQSAAFGGGSANYGPKTSSDSDQAWGIVSEASPLICLSHFLGSSLLALLAASALH